MAEDLEQILSGIEERVLIGMMSRFRMWLYYGGLHDQLVPRTLHAPAVALASMIATFEGLSSPHPMAELWTMVMELAHGRPYEVVSSVVRVGDVDVFFDSAIGPHPRRFAEEVQQDDWWVDDDRPIPAEDWETLLGGGEDEQDYDAYDLWDSLLQDAYHRDQDTFLVTRLYATENNDVLTVPDGMVFSDDEDAGNPESYVSWPKNTIDRKDDPRHLGYFLASVCLDRRTGRARVGPYVGYANSFGSPYESERTREMFIPLMNASPFFRMWIENDGIHWSGVIA